MKKSFAIAALGAVLNAMPAAASDKPYTLPDADETTLHKDMVFSACTKDDSYIFVALKNRLDFNNSNLDAAAETKIFTELDKVKEMLNVEFSALAEAMTGNEFFNADFDGNGKPVWADFVNGNVLGAFKKTSDYLETLDVPGRDEKFDVDLFVPTDFSTREYRFPHPHARFCKGLEKDAPELDIQI